MKLNFDKRPYHVGPKKTIGLLGFISTSMYKDHRKLVCLTLTVGHKQYGVSLHFGKRTYPEVNFQVGDHVICVDHEESCQLSNGDIYRVDRIEYKASKFDDETMSVRVHLEGFSDSVTYSQYRFRPASTKDYTGGPVS